MKLLPFLLLLLLPFSLYAEKTSWFIGLDGGVTGANLAASDANTSFSFGPEYGIKAGFQDERSRVYLGYTNANDIGSYIIKNQNVYIALDGVGRPFEVIGSATAKFFFGARLGASFGAFETEDITAFQGGFQTGLIFLLPVGFEIETSYRHYWTYRSREASDFMAGALAIGLNYKFGEN